MERFLDFGQPLECEESEADDYIPAINLLSVLSRQSDSNSPLQRVSRSNDYVQAPESSCQPLPGNFEPLTGNVELLPGNVELLPGNAEPLPGKKSELLPDGLPGKALVPDHGDHQHQHEKEEAQLLPGKGQLLPGKVQLLPGKGQLLPGKVQLLPGKVQLLPGNVESSIRNVEPQPSCLEFPALTTLLSVKNRELITATVAHESDSAVAQVVRLAARFLQANGKSDRDAAEGELVKVLTKATDLHLRGEAELSTEQFTELATVLSRVSTKDAAQLLSRVFRQAFENVKVRDHAMCGLFTALEADKKESKVLCDLYLDGLEARDKFPVTRTNHFSTHYHLESFGIMAKARENPQEGINENGLRILAGALARFPVDKFKESESFRSANFLVEVDSKHREKTFAAMVRAYNSFGDKGRLLETMGKLAGKVESIPPVVSATLRNGFARALKDPSQVNFDSALSGMLGNARHWTRDDFQALYASPTSAVFQGVEKIQDNIPVELRRQVLADAASRISSGNTEGQINALRWIEVLSMQAAPEHATLCAKLLGSPRDSARKHEMADAQVVQMKQIAAAALVKMLGSESAQTRDAAFMALRKSEVWRELADDFGVRQKLLEYVYANSTRKQEECLKRTNEMVKGLSEDKIKDFQSLSIGLGTARTQTEKEQLIRQRNALLNPVELAKFEELQLWVDAATILQNKQNRTGISGDAQVRASQKQLHTLSSEVERWNSPQLDELRIGTVDEKLVSHIAQKILERMQQPISQRFREQLGEFVKKRSTELPLVEAAALLMHVERLVSPTAACGDCRLTMAQREEVATELLQHVVSRGSTVNQGRFNTCELATIEKVLLEKEPSAVAALVVDAVLHGSIKDYTGKAIKLSSTPFQTDLAEKEPKRGLASQIFQTVLIERQWAVDPPDGFSPGQIKYKLTRPRAETDSGERLMAKDGVLFDPSDGVDGFPVTDPGVDYSKVLKIFDNLSRHKRGDKPLFVVSSQASDFVPERKGIDFIDLRSGSDLEKKLEQLKAAGAFPVIVATRIRSEDGFDLHVVTISDYDAKRKLVRFHDQQGTGGSQWIPVTKGAGGTALVEKMNLDSAERPWQLRKDPSKRVVIR